MYSLKYLINQDDYDKVAESYKNYKDEAGRRFYLHDYNFYESSDKSHTRVIKFSICSEEYGYMGEYIVENNKITQEALRLIYESRKYKNKGRSETECVVALVIAARHLAENTRVWLKANKKPERSSAITYALR